MKKRGRKLDSCKKNNVLSHNFKFDEFFSRNMCLFAVWCSDAFEIHSFDFLFYCINLRTCDCCFPFVFRCAFFGESFQTEQKQENYIMNFSRISDRTLNTVVVLLSFFLSHKHFTLGNVSFYFIWNESTNLCYHILCLI